MKEIQEKKPTYIHDDTRARFSFDTNEAISGLKEIEALADKSSEFAESLRSLIDEGAEFFVANVDWFSAKPTSNAVVRYQLSERVLSLLATFHADNREMDEISAVKMNGH